MTILDDEKKTPHLNSYFDCRWAAYGTEQSAPDRLPEAYQNQRSENPFFRKRYYVWGSGSDPRTTDTDDAIHPVFKIKKSSSEDDFKEVYKKMILASHPDKVEGKEQEFIKVRNAWETLDFNL
mgnify:FL=1